MTTARVSGIYRTNSLSPETFKSFIPHPLPPNPPLNLSGEHYILLDKAILALGRLLAAILVKFRSFSSWKSIKFLLE
jgi:hypothetical protein